MGMAEDGLLYAYVPLSGESYDTGYLMADGSMSPVALGGEPLGAGGPLLTAPDDDNDMLFGMLGWFALAAAGVGAAFALSEMDKDDGDNHSTPDKPSIGTTMDDEGSIKGPLKSGDTTDDSTPTLTGKGKLVIPSISTITTKRLAPLSSMMKASGAIRLISHWVKVSTS